MPANRIQLQAALQKPYDRLLFAKDVLRPIFNSSFTLNSSLVRPSVLPNQSESAIIDSVGIYGKIILEDSSEVTCYEIILKPNVRLEYSKVAIQHYVRKLLTVGQAALINFISPTDNSFWRLTLVAKDSVLTEKGITEKATNAKRYTYLLGPSETCKTPAERFELLSIETKLDLDILVKAFSVEKLSKAFFDEYTRHYEKFIEYLTKPANKKSLFNGDEKAIRDFSKKLLGRIVFLYFVQKKRWLGASDTNYKDGMTDFIMQLFHLSGSNASFYPNWLTKLFFDTLNSERKDDVFEMPDGKKIKIPFLNGGLFDKEEHDDKIIPFPASLFHNHDNEDDPKYRGFLDFLNAFNFTIYEDSPDEKTVAVDPEMLGHIFENLLEDNKDKGAFYTPKEIVHYMCQESLIGYLTTHLSKEYTVYQSLGNNQIEFLGNETRVGQLSLLEQMGDKALNSEDVSSIVKTKDISKLTNEQLKRIDKLLDSVKICDPAIGSGAFPMGLLQEIYSIKEVIAYETGNEWKPAEVKENIIQNSIYGVDIEKGAVDIARLRFWLSLVVDEDKPKPLPNLDYKIVVGDSLVSKFDGEVVEIEWNRTKSAGEGDVYLAKIKQLLIDVAEKQRKFFHPEIKNKKRLTAEIRNFKIELLINQLSFNKLNYINKNSELIDFGFGLTAKEKTKNSEIKLEITKYDNLLKKLNSLKRQPDQPFNHFDWKLDFPEVLNPYIVNENSGFDIVIGNPPYIDSRTNDLDTKSFWKKKYHSAQSGKTNAYEIFIEKGLTLLKSERKLCFIVPIVLLNLDACKSLRELLLTHYQIDEIAYGEKAVFENANVDTMIVFISSMKPSMESYIRINKFSENYSSIVHTTILKHFDITSVNGFKISVKRTLIHGILSSKENDYLKVSDILDFYNGIATGPDKEKYFSFIKINKNYKPLIMGNNIGYYCINDDGRYINYDRSKLHRPREEKIFLAKEKIVMQRIRNLRLDRRLVCALDINKFYTFNSVNNLLLKSNSQYNIRYFLALLNSTLLNYLLKQQSLNTNITLSDLELLPIKKIIFEKNDDLKLHNDIVKIVDYILFLKSLPSVEATLQHITTYLIQIIDGMVYELYFPGLLKKYNREIIKHFGELPAITEDMPDQKKMEIITEVFNRLNAKDHPVRVNLFYMDSIPEIRIIEGKDANN